MQEAFAKQSRSKNNSIDSHHFEKSQMVPRSMQIGHIVSLNIRIGCIDTVSSIDTFDFCCLAFLFVGTPSVTLKRGA